MRESAITAFWTVELDCGNHTEACTDLDCKPFDGARRVSAARKHKMLAELDARWG